LSRLLRHGLLGFSHRELIHVGVFTHVSTIPAPPPLPVAFPSPHRCLREVTPLSRCFRYYSTVRLLVEHRFPLRVSLIGSLIPLVQEPDEFSWGHALIFRTMPPAHTLVRRVNENAFASIVQARPCPVFGRPVHLGSRPRLRPGTSPQALQISPHGEHPALQWFMTTGQRGITPAFGYGAPHLSPRGTSTLPINALPSAHYGLLRLLTRYPAGFRIPAYTSRLDGCEPPTE
jgi:hypothetical protein